MSMINISMWKQYPEVAAETHEDARGVSGVRDINSDTAQALRNLILLNWDNEYLRIQRTSREE